ncbi:ABC transporter ATP-binding protein, partial [Pseudomonas aeruginosa]
MNDSTFNAHEYFQKIYERPVILEAKQLSQVFKHGQTEHTVLNKLDLKIHKREFICVIGPS